MNFIIYSHPYNENTGGVIALHKLCHCINELGINAVLYPFMPKLELGNTRRGKFFLMLIKNFWGSKKLRLKHLVSFLFRDSRKNAVEDIVKTCLDICFFHYTSTLNYQMNSAFKTVYSFAMPRHDTVVVYPEIVEGNPLNAKNVVRWFLHKPGFHTGNVQYGKNELYFFYQVIFNDLAINPNSGNLLQVMHIMDDVYYTRNVGRRSGRCYIIRKGKDRAANIDLSDGIIIDDMTHHEIANVFNSVEQCISYDMETMYSYYAALCGCISIVVPKEGVSKEEWQPKSEFRYGIAYGDSVEEVDEAKRTTPLLHDFLKTEELRTNDSVEKFIHTCDAFFGINRPIRL